MKTVIDTVKRIAWEAKRNLLQSGIRTRSKTWSKQSRDPKHLRRKGKSNLRNDTDE